MTEEEWQTNYLPHVMIGYLQKTFRSRLPKRKLRLYLCDCWRHLLGKGNGDLPSNLLVAERYADEQLSLDDMNVIRESVRLASIYWRVQAHPEQILAEVVLDRHKELWDSALRVTALVIQLRLADAFPDGFAPNVADAWRIRRDEERPYLAEMVRDIFGNPFRPVEFDPRWRTSDVLGLARAIYDDRAFDRLPILADALMDAGCADEQVLAHCREPGQHVRGCWVVDLVLGKE